MRFLRNTTFPDIPMGWGVGWDCCERVLTFPSQRRPLPLDLGWSSERPAIGSSLGWAVQTLGYSLTAASIGERKEVSPWTPVRIPVSFKVSIVFVKERWSQPSLIGIDCRRLYKLPLQEASARSYMIANALQVLVSKQIIWCFDVAFSWEPEFHLAGHFWRWLKFRQHD